MFLTTDELEQLTGYKVRPKQIQWLIEHGYKYELAAGGHPRVLRAHVHAKMGGTVDRTGPQLRLG